DMLDGDWAAASCWAFDLHRRWIAGLLINFLIRCWLVLDVKFGGGLRLEEQHLGFGRDAMIHLVHDRPAKLKALQVSRLAVRVSAGEHAFTLWQPALND